MKNDTIGQRIKNLRLEKGLTVDQLLEIISNSDEETSLSRATYYRYEGKNAENQPVKALKAIAKALGTSEEYLLGLTDDKRSKEWAMIEAYNRATTNHNEALEKLQQQLAQFTMQLAGDEPTKQLLKTAMILTNASPEYINLLSFVGNEMIKEISLNLAKAERQLHDLEINESSLNSAVEVIEGSIEVKSAAVSLSLNVLNGQTKALKTAADYISQEVAYYRKLQILVCDFLNNLHLQARQHLENSRND